MFEWILGDRNKLEDYYKAQLQGVNRDERSAMDTLSQANMAQAAASNGALGGAAAVRDAQFATAQGAQKVAQQANAARAAYLAGLQRQQELDNARKQKWIDRGLSVVGMGLGALAPVSGSPPPSMPADRDYLTAWYRKKTGSPVW